MIIYTYNKINIELKIQSLKSKNQIQKEYSYKGTYNQSENKFKLYNDRQILIERKTMIEK